MKKLFLSLAAVAMAATAASAGDCATCGGGGAVGYAPAPHGAWGPKAHKYDRFQGWFHVNPKQPKPATAPWYNYWPYNGQFMTPGPIAPQNGGGLVNPYFPG